MMLKTLGLAAIASLAASGAWANAAGECGILFPCTDVPEIDALAGTAALAALGASVALVWERRRR